MSDATPKPKPAFGGLNLNFITSPSPASDAPVGAIDGQPVEARVVIVGSGPAGLTAAIYAARANLEPVVIGGLGAGGQLMTTSEVENYPGFPEGIMGPELMGLFRKQAERFGTRIFDVDVEKVDFRSRPFKLWAGGREYRAQAVIVATGAEANWLSIESETRLRGRGVSACATCDGFFYRDKVVAVVGGGDTALEEALYLTRFAGEVHLVHRRDEFRGSKIMRDRVATHPKIRLHMNRTVDEVLGADKVEAVKLRRTDEPGEEILPIDGLFVAIGHSPNVAPFRDSLATDEHGYLKLQGATTASSIEGVFIAGDVDDPRYRQAVSAAGEGCRAAIDVERWLETQEANQETVVRATEAASAT